MRPFKFLTLSLTASLLLCGGAAQANLIENGSFEDPVAASSYTFLGVGDNIGGDWFVIETVNDVGLVRGSPAFALLNPYPDGDQMVYVGDSGRRATIVQPITTALQAVNHDLSFYLGTTDPVKPANVRVELLPITGGSGAGTTYGAAVFGQTFVGASNSPGVWQLVTMTIPVPSVGFYGLAIKGLDEDFVDNQTNVDNVILTPEPASIGLVVGGVFLILSGRKRRA